MGQNNYNTLCILCYKLSSSLELSEKDNSDRHVSVSTSEQFILLLSRHLKLSSKETTRSHVNRELLFCEVCSQLAKCFLQLYIRLECIRLKLEWNVRKIYETMLCAERVSSRFNAFKSQFETVSKSSRGEEVDEDREAERLQEVFTDLVKLRKDIIKRAKHQLKTSMPKVSLKRLPGLGKVIKTEAKSSPTKSHPLKKLEMVTDLLTSIVIIHLSLPLDSPSISSKFQERLSLVPDSDLVLIEQDLEEDALPLRPTSEHFDEAVSTQTCQDYDDVDDIDQMSVAVEYLVESNENSATDLQTENPVQMELDECNFTTHEDDKDSAEDDKLESVTLSDISNQKDLFEGDEVCNLVQNLDEPRENNVIYMGPENPVKMETDRVSNGDKKDIDSNSKDNVWEQVSIPSIIEKEQEEDLERKSLRTLLKCANCPKTFANQASLTAHGRIHEEKLEVESDSSSSDDDDETDEEMKIDVEEVEQNAAESHSDSEMEALENNEKLETEHTTQQETIKMEKKTSPKTSSKRKRLSTAPVKRIPTKIPANECEICQETFSCEGAVEKHRVLHHKLKNYARCHPCGKLFGSYFSLRRHVKFSPCLGKGPERDFPPQFPNFGGHLNGNKFCPLEGCYEVFQYEEWLDIHVKTHGDFECLQCPEEFTKAHDLAWHEVSLHNDKKCPIKCSHPGKDLTKLKYRCPRCNYGFERRISVITHFLHKHLGLSNLRTSGKAKKQCEICKYIFMPTTCSKQITSHKRLHDVEGLDPSAVATCVICKAPFKNQVLLSTHLKREHNQAQFNCPHCDKNNFCSRNSLIIHVRKKHPGKTCGTAGEFQCTICKERFSSKYNFEKHLKAHEMNDKPEFKCEKCSAVFPKRLNLSMHYYNMHKAPKETWPCETCGKVFKTKTHLKQHASYVHTDPSEWKFVCEEEGCGKRSWSRQKLREHMRTHTKERPFVCDFCGEAYRYREYLRSHLAKVHGESAASTLPKQVHRKRPFDQILRKQHQTTEKEGLSDCESSDSST